MRLIIISLLLLLAFVALSEQGSIQDHYHSHRAKAVKQKKPPAPVEHESNLIIAVFMTYSALPEFQTLSTG